MADVCACKRMTNLSDSISTVSESKNASPIGGTAEPQQPNIIFLPAPSNSNDQLRAYMPISFNNPQNVQTSQNNQRSQPPKQTDKNESVTKILVSNFEGPLTVKCTMDVPQLHQSYAPPMLLPPSIDQTEFNQSQYYYDTNYPSLLSTSSGCNGYGNLQRSRSNRRYAKGRSKSPRKLSNQRREPLPKDKKRIPCSKPLPSRSDSTSPLPSTKHSTLDLPSKVPIPTLQELQSVSLRPTRPTFQNLSVTRAQTVSTNEPEKRNDSHRPFSSDDGKLNLDYKTMFPSLPQKIIVKTHFKKNMKERPNSTTTRPHPSQDDFVKGPNLPPKNSLQATCSSTQQPIETQGLFGLKKVPPPNSRRIRQKPELPIWAQRRYDDDDENDDVGLKVLTTSDEFLSPSSSSLPFDFKATSRFLSENFKLPPKLAPKPTLQWTPRNQHGGLRQLSPILDSSSKEDPVVEEYYDVVLDYSFSENEVGNQMRSPRPQRSSVYPSRNPSGNWVVDMAKNISTGYQNGGREQVPRDRRHLIRQ